MADSKGRRFVITWYVTKEAKFRKPVERNNEIIIDKPSADAGMDAKLALNKFIRVFGGLNKNTIVQIQEYEQSEDGLWYPTGEPIKPMDDSTIVPTTHK